MKIIKEKDKTYPEKLIQIYDRPAKLYVEGNIDILNNKSIKEQNINYESDDNLGYDWFGR